MKKIIIVIFVLLAVLLIGGGVAYTFISDNTPSKPKEQQEDKRPQLSKDKINQEAKEHEVAELKPIITPDKKIRLGTTKVYKSNDICGMMLNIIPYEDFAKVYLEITLDLSKEKDIVIICLENVKKKEQLKYEIQSLKDWSKLKSWSVKIITEDEAIAAGYVRAAQ